MIGAVNGRSIISKDDIEITTHRNPSATSGIAADMEMGGGTIEKLMVKEIVIGIKEGICQIGMRRMIMMIRRKKRNQDGVHTIGNWATKIEN